MENNQKWSQAKPKKFIAQLLLDVETLIIPHFKPKEQLYPIQIGKSKLVKCRKELLNKGK